MYPVMGPLWCWHGTVPHTTLSVLFSTDVLVSPSGAPVGAEEEICSSCTEVRYYWCVNVPAVEVLVVEVIVLLLLPPNTAVTVIVQLLPALREEMV